MQRGQGHEGVEVVGLGGAVKVAPRALQKLHGPPEADVVAHCPQDPASVI